MGAVRFFRRKEYDFKLLLFVSESLTNISRQLYSFFVSVDYTIINLKRME